MLPHHREIKHAHFRNANGMFTILFEPFGICKTAVWKRELHDKRLPDGNGQQ